MEAIILVSFIVIQAAAKLLPRLASRVAHWPVVQRVSDNHWIVWLCHPVVLHGFHDYVIHFFIYSGYVLRSH